MISIVAIVETLPFLKCLLRECMLALTGAVCVCVCVCVCECISVQEELCVKIQ